MIKQNRSKHTYKVLFEFLNSYRMIFIIMVFIIIYFINFLTALPSSYIDPTGDKNYYEKIEFLMPI